ncbi:esterase E4-like [Contarinia nasturtii]|uniref:esterase E4-like n=1 Tax=Contarinia nasturtii TaxID=265458 RepID=UPI0012D4630A|nr:esterase E4-like [Contarinia nasturtii]XP_031622631.1 esterase E4-like [Contarinia nasturtii]
MIYQRWYKMWWYAFTFAVVMPLWLALINSVVNGDADVVEVDIESGRIRGKRSLTLYNEKPYYSFRGIPYAHPPTKDLRFKAPKKVAHWIDPRDAFDFSNDCTQFNFQTNEVFGNEDCLYLNVYAPVEAIEQANDGNFSVIVYVMGEAFQSGSAQHYGPDFFIEKDVIVVTFNYRLGPIGFMSLNLPDYAGNMGHKDQVLALKWVDKNIIQFGGGGKTTLLGHDSGAISVSLHMISPASVGLFENAIMLSGSALNPSIPRVKDHLTLLYNLAESLHYPVDNNRDLLEFLRQIDGKLLTKRTHQDFSNPGFGRRMANLIWATAVEHPHAVDKFIDKTPFDILTDDNYKTNVNALFGCTFEEMYGEFIEELKNPALLKPFDEIFELQLPLRNAKLKFHSKEYKEMSTKVRELYFKGNRVDNDTITGFQQLMTDVWFLYGIDLNARIHANRTTGHTYFSTFSVKSDWNLSSRKGRKFAFNFNFSNHFDQLPYLFRLSGQHLLPESSYENLAEDSFERKIIDKLTDFYANFAKFSNPLPDANPNLFQKRNATDVDPYHYLDITNHGIIAKINPNRKRIEFWNDIFEKYSVHWQTREFNLNSLAVKIPLLLLASLLSAIFCCKGISMCLKKNRKSMTVHSH